MSQSRRDFLKSAVGVTAGFSLSPIGSPFLTPAVFASEASNEKADRVLVVVQLSGGNDGLNTVVPFGDDAYGRNRRTLRLTGSDVHKIDSMVGFHPEIPGFAEMFKEGRLSIVQGVGYPNNNRDHDVAMRDWHTARPGDSTCQAGWIGRALDLVDRPETANVLGALVAPIPPPFALNAEGVVVPSVTRIQQLSLNKPLKAMASRQGKRRPAAKRDTDLLAELVRQGTADAYVMSQRVKDVLANPTSVGEYPSFTMAQQFQAVVQLIRANLGIRVFYAELGGGGGIGGFDNHASQCDNHAALLRQVSASMTAFVDDLARQELLDRVLLMTVSEFGRTLSENGRRGTGHGSAAPVFLAGGKLKGGFVGERPSLTDLDQDAPKFHTDFRRVYATVLDQWLGFDSKAILGRTYPHVDILA